MKVKCVNDNVDGLTKGLEYEVSDIFIRNNSIKYGMRDDYKVYNEFNSDRFDIISRFELWESYKGINISIRLE